MQEGMDRRSTCGTKERTHMRIGKEKLYIDIRYTNRLMCIYDVLAADNESDNGNGQRIIYGRRRMVNEHNEKAGKRI